MKQTRLIMGMPITVEIVGGNVDKHVLEDVFDYFSYVDQKFSTYKKDSEISLINGGLPYAEWSHEMKAVLNLCEQTKQETDGYFDIWHDGRRDPSGLVKGWAIQNASDMLRTWGVVDFYVDAGGDIQVSGSNPEGQAWRVGIRNPFNRDEIIKTLAVSSEGVATSGAYIRGQHIYNPSESEDKLDEIASLTVIGPDIYNADRFATAAYAMGPKGINYIENLAGYEAYAVDKNKIATLTSGFGKFVAGNA